MVNLLLKDFKDSDPQLRFNLTRDFRLLNILFGENGGPAILKDGTINWTFLREHYQEGVYIRRGTHLEWKEEILTLDHLEDTLSEGSRTGELVFQGYATDSFTVQA